MRCQYCGGRCNGYDGGEAANYELWVQVCEDCGEWQDEETDEEDEDEVPA